MIEASFRILIECSFCIPFGDHDKCDAPENEEYRVELSPGHAHDEWGIRLAKELIADSRDGVGDEEFSGKPARSSLRHVGFPKTPLHEGKRA